MVREGRREEREARRGRLARLRAAAGSRPWAALLAANLLPGLVAAGVAVAYAQGKVTFAPGATNLVPGLVVLFVLLALLVFLAWIVAPVVMSAIVAVLESLRTRRREARRGAGAFLVRAPLLAALAGAYLVLWANAILLALLVVADSLVVVASLVFLAMDVLSVRGG